MLLATIGALASFIPVTGEIVKSGIELYSLYLEQDETAREKAQEKEEARKERAAEMKKLVETLETDMKDFFKQKDGAKKGGFVATVANELRSWQRNGVFEMTEPNQRATIEVRCAIVPLFQLFACHSSCPVLTTHANKQEKYGLLQKWTTETTVDDSFLRIVNELSEETYVWGDFHTQTMVMSLITLYVQCMQLRCVLSANLATGYRLDHNESEAEARTARIRNVIFETRTFLQNQASVYGGWMDAAKVARRKLLGDLKMDVKWSERREAWVVAESRSVHEYYGTDYHHRWYFTDDGSKKTFELKVLEHNFEDDRRKDLGIRVTLAAGWMERLRREYGEHLEAHILAQFHMFGEVVQAWRDLAGKLEAYASSIGDQDVVKGVEIYQRMVAPRVAGEVKPA